MMNESVGIEEVSIEGFDEVVDVLCDAFYDYPVMRCLIGDVGDDYDRQLRLLVGFFSRARYLRQDLVWSVRHEGAMIGVANIVRPDTISPPELGEYRQALWADLGDGVRQRYEAFGEATEPFSPVEPHYHLSMLGVRRLHAGRGIGRRLLDALHDLSSSDSGSNGVSLTTETPGNVGLYQHFGYEIVGYAEVEGLESWTFFRPD